MTKKSVCILLVLSLIVIIIGIIYLKNNSSKTEIQIKDYSISIHSKKDGQASDNSFYTIPFEIIDEEKYKNKYSVKFIDIELFSEYSSDGMIDDIPAPEEVIINGKKFEYYLNGFGDAATLYYRLPDEKGRLVVDIIGEDVFTDKGIQIKTTAGVNREVLESDELAEVLDFSI